jgi:hypothetical protein
MERKVAFSICALCVLLSPMNLSAAHSSNYIFSTRPNTADDSQTRDFVELLRARRLMVAVRNASYPELKDADIQLGLFHSQSDYFRTRFSLSRFFFWRKMRYVLEVNPNIFNSDVSEAGLRAIMAHELGHVLYFKQRKRVRLLGLLRLLSAKYTARFERWTDLQAISRGYGPGLIAYRQWLYQHIPSHSLAEKKRDYFSPDEITAILHLSRNKPQLLSYWFSHVPLDLEAIKKAN